MSVPSSQFNYPLSPILLTASQVGSRIPVSLGGYFQGVPWIVAYNESSFAISIITQQGTITNIQAGCYDKVPLEQGSTSFFITPTSFLPTGNPISEVDINVYPFGEPEGSFPGVNPRQTAPVSAAVKFGYSINFTVSGAGPFQMFNVFNPANSGKNYIFYSAPITITTGTATIQVAIFILVGPDINFANSGGAAQPHDLSSPPSLAHCTFQSTNLPANIHSEASIIFIQPATPSNLLQNGDLCVIHPGQNCLMLANTTTQIMNGQLSWYEQ